MPYASFLPANGMVGHLPLHFIHQRMIS